MHNPAPDTLLIDEATAAFIQHRVSINVASRDAGNVPAVARAYGCRVAADRHQVTLFLCPNRAGVVLDNLRDNGHIAVVFNRPSTHETIQIKGNSVRIDALSPTEHAPVVSAWNSFVEEILSIGFSDAFGRTITAAFPEALVGVSFAPSEAFIQTPGQHAGQRLGGKT